MENFFSEIMIINAIRSSQRYHIGIEFLHTG